jgi:PAS domain S-box-containing protein
MTFSQAPHQTHSVLVVDDDDKIREMLHRVLSREGFDVMMATSPVEASSLLDERLPCMVLMDVMMPGMDGFEFCRCLKQNPRTAHLPVALISARTEESDVQEGILAGAVDYIKKPFDKDELRMRVRSHIRLHEATAEQQRLHKHMEVISSAAKDAIILIDNDGKIFHWNEAAEAIFGYAQNEALGRHLHKLLVPQRSYASYCEAFPRFQQTGEGAEVGKTRELTAVRKSGEEFPIELSLAKASIDGKWCAVGVVRDISNRKSMEDALRKSENQYRSLYKLSRDALVTLGPPTWKFSSCNHAALKLFAVESEDEFMKLGPWDVSPERQPQGHLSSELAKANIEKAMREGSANFNWMHMRVTGEAFPGNVLLTRVDSGGEPILQATVRDVTERVQAEAALQASEAKYRASFEDASVGQALTSKTGKFLEVNPALANMLGYSLSELTGKTFTELTHPEDVTMSLDAHRSLYGGQRVIRMEKRYLRKDGTIFWADVNIAALRDSSGEVDQCVTHIVDLSERKCMEERLRVEEAALRYSEQFARSTVDALSAHIAIVDESGFIIMVNSAWRQFASENSVAVENLSQGANYLDICDAAEGRDSEGAAEFAAGIRAVLQGQRDEFALEYLCSSPEEVRWFVGRVTRFPDASVNRVVIAHENVTERKRAEEVTREGSAFLDTLLNAIPVPIFYKDANGQYSGANRAFADFFGKAAEDILGKTVLDVYPRKVAEYFVIKDRELLAQQGIQIFDAQLENSSGKMRDVVFHRATFTHANGRAAGLIGALLDVTDRKQMEAELGHARKLEAVGQLAAGIAHEINTPAQYVGDGIYFLKESFENVQQLVVKYHKALEALERCGKNPELLNEIRAFENEIDLEYMLANAPGSFDRCIDGVSRISTIVRAMKEFSHPDQREKSPADLNQALQSTLIIARNEYKYVADLETEYGDLPHVLCHLGDLNQAFLNLIVNAAHAIGEVVGKSGEKGKIGIRTLQENDTVRIDLTDTGAGIPESIRERVFDPFFTTKEVGKGSGQGLAIARSVVVDKHGGTLTFNSEVGRGTTFTIRLPIGGNRSGPGECHS